MLLAKISRFIVIELLLFQKKKLKLKEELIHQEKNNMKIMEILKHKEVI